MKTARIKPMVNQIEYHPGWMQNAVVSYCEDAQVFDFELSAEDVLKIDNIYDCGVHYEMPDDVDF